MKTCNIFFSVDDSLTELDIIEKGWRGDILVQIENVLFNPTVFTPERLCNEFNNANSKKQVYDIDNNIVLVEKTDRLSIIETLAKLVDLGYFTKVKQVDLKKDFNFTKNALCDLKNWIQVY